LKAKLGLDQCEWAVTSTAPIPADVLNFFAAIGLPLAEVWGMSELTGPATATPDDAIKIGTVGTPYPGVEIALAEDGEVLARGGNLMQGYYREPEKTAEAIDADGWMHTGDVGEIDADGNLRIIDRKKELIVTSYGKNISPANIESLLLQHPLVGFACAVGDGRQYMTALLVLDAQTAPAWAKAQGIEFESAADLATNPEVLTAVGKAVEEVNQHLSHAEQIKKFKLLPAEWTAESEELTPTLKLKRRVVLKKYADAIEEMYRAG
jgi:long-chain acyl-CoA synthetase